MAIFNSKLLVYQRVDASGYEQWDLQIGGELLGGELPTNHK